MPLVRIDTLKTNAQLGPDIGRIVYETLQEVFKVPADDNFQVISAHEAGGLIYDPHYLGISRGDGIIFIQITLNEGRPTASKQAFYSRLAEELAEQLCLREEDVLINLVEVKKENWSFGNGLAQYL